MKGGSDQTSVALAKASRKVPAGDGSTWRQLEPPSRVTKPSPSVVVSQAVSASLAPSASTKSLRP